MPSSEEAGSAVSGKTGRKHWASYVVALVAGGLLAIPFFAGLGAVLDRQGAMPPPLITNNLCVDNKLSFMRKHRPGNVNLLVVGSSSALRHFNTAEILRIDSRSRPYNAGLCAINLPQSERVIDWLTGRLTGVHRVLLVASSLEFGDCAHDSRLTLNIADADRYVFGNTSRFGFYLKFFNPTVLLRNAIGLQRKRTDRTQNDSFVFNQFGDAPINAPDNRQWYIKAKLDDRCFTTLRRTALALQARGIQFALVESPMNPLWRQEFDQSGALTPVTRRRIGQAFSGTDAVLIEDQTHFSPTDFYDAVHIRASSTARFTRSVLAQLDEVDRGKSAGTTGAGSAAADRRN